MRWDAVVASQLASITLQSSSGETLSISATHFQCQPVNTCLENWRDEFPAVKAFLNKWTAEQIKAELDEAPYEGKDTFF